jgi:hypothetical protein
MKNIKVNLFEFLGSGAAFYAAYNMATGELQKHIKFAAVDNEIAVFIFLTMIGSTLIYSSFSSK